MKLLFVLVYISGGHEWIVIKDAPLEHCVARLMFERQAIVQVQEKHPEINASLECRPQ